MQQRRCVRRYHNGRQYVFKCAKCRKKIARSPRAVNIYNARAYWSKVLKKAGFVLRMPSGTSLLDAQVFCKEHWAESNQESQGNEAIAPRLPLKW